MLGEAHLTTKVSAAKPSTRHSCALESGGRTQNFTGQLTDTAYTVFQFTSLVHGTDVALRHRPVCRTQNQNARSTLPMQVAQAVCDPSTPSDSEQEVVYSDSVPTHQSM